MMVRHASALYVVQSLDRLDALTAAPPSWHGNNDDVPQVTVHSAKSAGGLFNRDNPRWLTPHIIGMFEEMLEAWPGAPAVDRAFLTAKEIPDVIPPTSFVHLVNAIPPTIRKARTAAQWEAISGLDVILANLVDGHWVVTNPAWLT